MLVASSPATDEAHELIRELDLDIAALYPGLPINGIDAAEFESAGGYFVIACSRRRKEAEGLAIQNVRLVTSAATQERELATVVFVRSQGAVGAGGGREALTRSLTPMRR
jgi:hypothetical protein